MLRTFETKTYSLNKLHTKRFIIPSYQRPYVWGDEQINKLLSDFHDAYERGDNHYFIGTVLTSKKGDIEELIDGQQRFTTLWLISVSFKILGEKSRIIEYLKTGDDLRFDFAIRKQLKSYLLSLLEKTKNEKNQYSDSEVENDEYLVNVAKAVTTIVKKIETFSFSDGKSLKGFGDYIFENIQFVMNTAPSNTNLNKLFSTINNSGVQLEQSDILKSKLLHIISKDKGFNAERVLYSKIWEACENMENYFERNVRKLFPKTEWKKIDKEDFREFNPDLFKFREEAITSTQQEQKGFDIASIINKEAQYQKTDIEKLLQETEADDDEVEKVYCRSIINFSQLLLHTYRIYLKQEGREDFEGPFHIKHLLEVFKSLEKENETFIKGFFLCLWQVRFAFDKYVIKWVQKSEDKEEELKITTVSQSDKGNNRFFSRTQPEARDASTMLQSVLYFTGNYNTQIWLSAFLKRLLDGEDAELCLEAIDNQLSLSQEEDKLTTYMLMDASYDVADKLNFELYLQESNGTSFKHYWFQKLEYILWKGWQNKSDPKYREYRITSKNSVEHVFPQHHEFEMELDDEYYLNCFGNLGLLSVSQNSSYSNQDVEKKKVDFDRKSVYDSLKLALIYCDKDVSKWRGKKILFHQEQMIEKIKSHYEL